MMSIKEQLIHEIEQVPERVAEQLLSILHLLQAQPPTPSPETKTDENSFECIDGIMVLPKQEALPDIDWVSLVREERSNRLMQP